MNIGGIQYNKYGERVDLKKKYICLNVPDIYQDLLEEAELFDLSKFIENNIKLGMKRDELEIIFWEQKIQYLKNGHYSNRINLLEKQRYKRNIRIIKGKLMLKNIQDIQSRRKIKMEKY